jgi:hypothetical protein
VGVVFILLGITNVRIAAALWGNIVALRELGVLEESMGLESDSGIEDSMWFGAVALGFTILILAYGAFPHLRYAFGYGPPPGGDKAAAQGDDDADVILHL